MAREHHSTIIIIVIKKTYNSWLATVVIEPACFWGLNPIFFSITSYYRSRDCAFHVSTERATMALGEPPEEYVIRSNLISVAQAVQRNLNVISQQLIREAFITAAAADNIIGTLGMPPASKANGFMQCVQSKMSRSHATREQWFEKFVTILANHTAEGELVMKLIRDFG